MKKKGRKKNKDENGEKRIRFEIAQKLVEGIKGKACVHEGVNSTAQRAVGQSVKQNWDSSRVENEEEEEEKDWQEVEWMAVQWDEEQKLEEILARRRMEGNSLQLEVMQKAPELVVHERMSQGEKAKGTKEKKKVKGWSIEEMKDKVNSLVEIDTEEMSECRGLSEKEID